MSNFIVTTLAVVIVAISLLVGMVLGDKHLPKNSRGQSYYGRGDGIFGTLYFLLTLVVLSALLGFGIIFVRWLFK